MGLHPDVRVLRRQLPGPLQLRSAAAGYKTRCDGVAQAVHAVPLLDQAFGVDQALLRLVAHAVGGVLVHQHLACNHPQAAALRLAQQRVDRCGVGRGERQRRGHAMAQQLVDEK